LASIAPLRKDLAGPVIEPGKLVERVQLTQIDLAPGVQTGLHLHPGPVVGYVVKGEITFQIEGQPAQVLRAGDAFYEPANTRILHFDNASPTNEARFVAVYLLGQEEQELIRLLDG
jgi:quercetin dioxygenase-like cupin family protein